MSSLLLKLYSFSYKRAFPAFSEEHGGGYIFDCRCLPNPGREPHFHDKTGCDPEVAAYLKQIVEVDNYFENVWSVVNQSIANYSERDFTLLEVAFGCTGGQHRSVYMTERLARRLELRSVNHKVFHMESRYKEDLNWVLRWQ